MNLPESHLLSILGKRMSDSAVQRTLVENELTDTEEDPLHRKYVGSQAKGIDLLFENDCLVDIQIYVEPSKLYAFFTETLPFGLARGMHQEQVHGLLGPPKTFDKFDSKYSLHENSVQLSIAYDERGRIRFLSIGLPLE